LGRPLVYRVEVEPSQVIALHDARDEREVILNCYNLDASTVTIDGTDINCEELDPDYVATPDLIACWRRSRSRYIAKRRSRGLK
jgi:hypothetical protein